MSWEPGKSTVDYLIDKERLERIDAGWAQRNAWSILGRARRQSAQYFDPARPEITAEDARSAIETTTRTVTTTRQLLESGRLSVYD